MQASPEQESKVRNVSFEAAVLSLPKNNPEAVYFLFPTIIYSAHLLLDFFSLWQYYAVNDQPAYS